MTALDNALVTDNPVSRARAFEGCSLEKLGKKLGVSKQYLSRAEHATYSGINRNLARWVANTLELSVREVDRQYAEFQSEKRRRAGQGLGHERFLSRKGSEEPGYLLFRKWRESYWASQLEFCKDLCVHPQSVENYEDGIVVMMPALIQDAMREARLLDPNWIDIVDSESLICNQRRIADVPETEALRAVLGPYKGARGGNYLGEGRSR